MKLRKDKNKRTLTQPGYDELQLTSSSGGPERLALNSELREYLQSGLDRLAPNLKTAVVLRNVQGLTNQEAALILKISISSLKARLHRGRVVLQDYLQDYLQEYRQDYRQEYRRQRP